jgi:hypothetical protein
MSMSAPPLPWYDTPMRDLTLLGWIWVTLTMIVLLGLLWLATVASGAFSRWLRQRRKVSR